MLLNWIKQFIDTAEYGSANILFNYKRFQGKCKFARTNRTWNIVQLTAKCALWNKHWLAHANVCTNTSEEMKRIWGVGRKNADRRWHTGEGIWCEARGNITMKLIWGKKCMLHTCSVSHVYYASMHEIRIIYVPTKKSVHRMHMCACNASQNVRQIMRAQSRWNWRYMGKSGAEEPLYELLLHCRRLRNDLIWRMHPRARASAATSAATLTIT